LLPIPDYPAIGEYDLDPGIPRLQRLVCMFWRCFVAAGESDVSAEHYAHSGHQATPQSISWSRTG